MESISPQTILDFLDRFAGSTSKDDRELLKSGDLKGLDVQNKFGLITSRINEHLASRLNERRLSFDVDGRGKPRTTTQWYPQRKICTYFWSTLKQEEYADLPLRVAIFAEKVINDGKPDQRFRFTLEVDRVQLAQLENFPKRDFFLSYYAALSHSELGPSQLILGANEKNSTGEINGKYGAPVFESVDAQILEEVASNNFGELDRKTRNRVLSGDLRLQPSFIPPSDLGTDELVKWGAEAIEKLLVIYESVCAALRTEAAGEDPEDEDPQNNLETVSAPITSNDLCTVLFGPPGTGKTFATVERAVQTILGDEDYYDSFPSSDSDFSLIAKHYEDLSQVEVAKTHQLTSSNANPQIEFLTFHQSYSYEDFIEGIRPVVDKTSGQVRYEYHDGIFKRLCKRALENPDRNYVLIIDEINRGNLSKIFGELITLLEKSKRVGEPEAKQVTLPYSGEKFEVPTNLYLIGTMNTADRSVAAFDTAFRRRFVFEELMPDYEVLPEKVPGTSIDLRLMLRQINDYIEFILDRDHVIGHAYLMGLDSMDDLEKAFKNKIFPLLQEYFFDDYEKIRFVLGDNYKGDELAFVVEESSDFAADNQFGFSTVRYQVNWDAFAKEESYKQIYAPPS